MHTDNQNVYYENKSLKLRFPNTNKSIKMVGIKSNCVHKINRNLVSCNGFGEKTYIQGVGTDKLDNEYYYIDHYFCKSTEEFVNKINKGDVFHNRDNFLERIKVYFAINKVTKEKLDYIRKYLFKNISFEKNISI